MMDMVMFGRLRDYSMNLQRVQRLCRLIGQKQKASGQARWGMDQRQGVARVKGKGTL
jgi:hypothetical protein